MKNTFLLAIIRHLLTTAGGWMVAQDIASQAQWDTIAGAVFVIAGIGWSLIDKKLRR